MRLCYLFCSIMLFLPMIAAHEFWLIPSSYTPKINAPVRLQLHIGHHFDSQTYPRNPQHIQQFIVIGEGQTQWVNGRPGSDPAGWVRIRRPGIYCIGYSSTQTLTILDSVKFEEYLQEEGLAEISEWRKKNGQSDKEGREVYSRCAKSLIAVGEKRDKGYDAVLNFALELVVENNPYQLKPGETLSVRLLYNDKPLPGRVIYAVHSSYVKQPLSQQSNEQGRVAFTLPWSGEWLIETVHMVATVDDPRADWESFWASVTFTVPSVE